MKKEIILAIINDKTFERLLEINTDLAFSYLCGKKGYNLYHKADNAKSFFDLVVA